MRISFKGDYAIKALLYLSQKYAGTQESYYQINEISRDQDIPEKFLEQIFLLLRKAGYLKSHRGANGGFALNRDPETVTLGEIIRLIEGPIAPIACVSREAHQTCNFETRCVLRPLWQEVSEAVSGIVDSVTFRTLVERENERLKKQAESLMYHI